MNLGIKEVFAFGASYLVAVGACYLFGYWGAFQLNVLEYISFADIAKLAVYPLLASLAFVLAGVAFSELLHAPHFPPGGGNNTPISQFGLRHWRLLLGMQIIVTVLIATFAPEPGKWFVVAFLISLFSTAFAHVENVIEILPNPRLRATVLFLSLLLPTLGFAYGRLQAHLVKTGAADYFVDVERSKLPLTSDAKNPVAYLGLLGNLYVLREGKTRLIVFVKQRDDSPLFLVPRQ